MRHAWIIATGTELALGQTVNTNGAWLAARLAALGIRTERHITVADDAAATRDSVLQAAQASDVVLITGGLGPTDDDLTRQALADAAGVPLELHAPSLEHLRAFFANRGREMPERNRVQALVPHGARALENSCGTAPGVRIELYGTPCFALPGVPFEMRAMFERAVGPELRATAGGTVLLSRRLHTVGLGESDIGMRLRDLMQRGRNPEVGTTAEFGLVGIRVNAAAETRAAAEAGLEATEDEIRRRLGELVFGRDEETLAGVVGALLVAAGETLSTAESCTGGMIGALLTDVAGSSRYYCGGVVAYANEAKVNLLGVAPTLLAEHGAVSAPVARAMAEGATRSFGTDYGIAVTGIAGPDGGTAQKPVGLVYIGLQAPDSGKVGEYRFGADSPREAIRIRAARMALDVLRRHMLRGSAGDASGGGR